MPRKEILDQIQKYTHPFRITNGKRFQLRDFDPGDTRGLKMDKADAAELLQRGTGWLAEEQDMLYAQDRWSLLLIFQAMDAAGKDSTIKHVMSGVNPHRCASQEHAPCGLEAGARSAEAVRCTTRAFPRPRAGIEPAI